MRINSIELRTELYKQGMTQKELAKRVYCSKGYINEICNGRSCSRKTGEAIAAALGVALEDLQ